jgi:hypothetical protein
MIELKKTSGTLKSSIQKIVLTLCLLLTVCFSAHSQDTSRITLKSDSLSTTIFKVTGEQLRTANLIFAEHKEFSQVVPLLRQENYNLQLINESWERTDSIKTAQLYNKNNIIDQQTVQIENLQKDLNTSLKVTGTVTGISIAIAVLCLLLK